MSLIPAAYRGAGADGENPIGSEVLGCRIERCLGRGGMGAVYLARRADGVPLVAKVLLPEFVDNVQLRSRFEREWRALQKLPPHPHLVRIEAVTTLGPSPCILMEHVSGRTLFQLVRERGRFDPGFAARTVGQVAQAIAVVHDHGLLHRDLTPNNVMLTESGEIKVIDFGLAKDLFRTTLTAPGQILGTVHYMAPEQLAGGAVDARSDVFALGATLYQLLTGVPPFGGGDLAEVVELIVEGEFALPSERVPELPKAFDELIQQLLAPDLQARHGSMREVADDLGRILQGVPCSAPCLLGPGLRVALLGARRFVIGVEAGVPVRLDAASVAPRHAQLRREQRGFVLYDLRSPGGTWVQGEPVTTTPRLLADGDRIRVGEVELSFENPRSRR